MRSLLTAAALCAALQGALAQGTCAPAAAGTPAGPSAHATPAAAQAHAAQRIAAAAVPAAPDAPVHGELIKTAAAGTRDGLPTGVHRPPEEHPQRGGLAMALAALALMSGIALRRYSGPRA